MDTKYSTCNCHQCTWLRGNQFDRIMIQSPPALENCRCLQQDICPVHPELAMNRFKSADSGKVAKAGRMIDSHEQLIKDLENFSANECVAGKSYSQANLIKMILQALVILLRKGTV